jgi:hypothetical protein
MAAEISWREGAAATAAGTWRLPAGLSLGLVQGRRQRSLGVDDDGARRIAGKQCRNSGSRDHRDRADQDPREGEGLFAAGPFPHELIGLRLGLVLVGQKQRDGLFRELGYARSAVRIARKPRTIGFVVVVGIKVRIRLKMPCFFQHCDASPQPLRNNWASPASPFCCYFPHALRFRKSMGNQPKKRPRLAQFGKNLGLIAA